MKCARANCFNHVRRGGQWCNQHYESFRREREARGGRKCGWIPNQPVLDHIQRLKDCGVGNRRIAELSGVTPQSIQRMRRHPLTYVDTAHKILSIPIPRFPHDLAADACKVPITGSLRRLRALNAIGYTNRELADRLRTTDKVVSFWSLGRQEGIFAEKARDIDALFRELQMVPPPNATANKRVKLRAQRRGWLPPLAWDEDSIDDPNAEPQLPEDPDGAWFDDYRELRALGLTNDHIAERWGLQRESLRQRLRRLLPDDEYERYIA